MKPLSKKISQRLMNDLTNFWCHARVRWGFTPGSRTPSISNLCRRRVYLCPWRSRAAEKRHQGYRFCSRFLGWSLGILTVNRLIEFHSWELRNICSLGLLKAEFSKSFCCRHQGTSVFHLRHVHQLHLTLREDMVCIVAPHLVQASP